MEKAQQPPLVQASLEAAERYGQGFRAGYNALNVWERNALRHALYSAGMGRKEFYRYLNGTRKMYVEVAARIAAAFAGYGIGDPWGPGTRKVTRPRKKKEGGKDEQ